MIVATRLRRADRLPGAARPDHRHRSPARQARPGDRLALSRGAVRRGLFRQGGASAAADTADGGALAPQAHAQSVRRGSVRPLAREPVLSVVLRPALRIFWRADDAPILAKMVIHRTADSLTLFNRG